MKLCLINESTNQLSKDMSPNVRIYHKALIWPGSFVGNGLSVADAKALGFKSGMLTGDDPDESSMGCAGGFKCPHPLILDAILELPDIYWEKALMAGSKLLNPKMRYYNFRIVDRGFDEHNMMVLQYIADVNLQDFLKSVSWNDNDMKVAESEGWFKILSNSNK